LRSPESRFPSEAVRSRPSIPGRFAGSMRPETPRRSARLPSPGSGLSHEPAASLRVDDLRRRGAWPFGTAKAAPPVSRTPVREVPTDDGANLRPRTKRFVAVPDTATPNPEAVTRPRSTLPKVSCEPVSFRSGSVRVAGNRERSLYQNCWRLEARNAASVRLVACSLRMICRTCTLTVLSRMASS
jgi:hypothetical protein